MPHVIDAVSEMHFTLIPPVAVSTALVSTFVPVNDKYSPVISATLTVVAAAECCLSIQMNTY